MKPVIVLTVIGLLLIFASGANAQIPKTISYQGVLCDASGNPRPDNTYNITFRLYEAASGGTAIWTEAKSLQVTRGLFYTLLGSSVPFGAAVTFDKPYWLSLQVGSDVELSPRVALASMPYSFSSTKADTAGFAKVAGSGGTSGPWLQSADTLYYLGGNVGVGTKSPTVKLQVSGGPIGGQGLSMYTVTYPTNPLSAEFLTYNMSATNWGGIGGNYEGGIWCRGSNFNFWVPPYSTSVPAMAISSTGSLGIGTMTPQATLHVEGNAGRGQAAIYGQTSADLFLKDTDAGTDLKQTVLRNENGGSYYYALTDAGGIANTLLSMSHASGNVGIGTASPAAKLEVDGSLLLSGTSGATPTSGAGTRLMWIPAKAAFRAGSVTEAPGTWWDDVNVGLNSIAMGSNTTASGNYSIAMGSNVRGGQEGDFIIGDHNEPWLENLTANEFCSVFSGGYVLFTNRLFNQGVYMNGNTSGWTSMCDRNKKENFQPIDGEELLSKIRALPITRWNYKKIDPSIQYIGPVAQDFYAAFHLGGKDSLGINSICIDGVNMAAVKALEKRTAELREKTAELEVVKSELSDLKARLVRVEQALSVPKDFTQRVSEETGGQR